MIAYNETKASLSEFRDISMISRQCFDADRNRAYSDERVPRNEIDLLQNESHHLT